MMTNTNTGLDVETLHEALAVAFADEPWASGTTATATSEAEGGP